MKLRHILPFLFMIFLIIPLVSAGNVQYSAEVYAPADLLVHIYAPPKVPPGFQFPVIANVSNQGTENALNVVAELTFLDMDNDAKHGRKAFIYSEPVKSIGTLRGMNSQNVTWNVKTRNEKRYTGNYSIIVKVTGIAQISGEKLAEEGQKGVAIPGFEILGTCAGLFLASRIARRDSKR
jgi:hypothetical protein